MAVVRKLWRKQERTMLAPTKSSSLQIIQGVERVKGVFTDVPGTQLSITEVARLSGLEAERCEPILDALVAVGFLTCGRNGRFRQVD